MLKWDINIAGDFSALGDRLNEFVRPMGRMGIKETDPEIALKII